MEVDNMNSAEPEELYARRRTKNVGGGNKSEERLATVLPLAIVEAATQPTALVHPSAASQATGPQK